MARGTQRRLSKGRRRLQAGGITVTGFALCLAGIASGLGVWAVLERLDSAAESHLAGGRTPESLDQIEPRHSGFQSLQEDRGAVTTRITPVVPADTWMRPTLEPVPTRTVTLRPEEQGTSARPHAEAKAIQSWKGAAADRWIVSDQLPAGRADWEIDGWQDVGSWAAPGLRARRAFRAIRTTAPRWATLRVSRPAAAWSPVPTETTVREIDFRPPRPQGDGELNLFVSPRWRDYDLAVVWGELRVVTPADLIFGQAGSAEDGRLRLSYRLEPTVARAGAPKFQIFARAREKWNIRGLGGD
jgi:hypothetical protein